MNALSFQDVHAQRIPPVKEKRWNLIFFVVCQYTGAVASLFIFLWCVLVMNVQGNVEMVSRGRNGNIMKNQKERVSLGEGGKKRGEKCLA